MSWIDIGITVGLIHAWAILGFVCAFRLFGFPDLTLEGSVPLGAAVYAVMVRNGNGIPFAVLMALLAGCLCGVGTAILHSRLHVNKFLSGIIVVAITYSLTLRVLGGSNLGLLTYPTIFDWLHRFDDLLPGFHIGQLLFLALLAVGGATVGIVTLSTRPGLRLRAIGSNPAFASSLGLNIELHLIVGLALCNTLAALTGVFLAMHGGFADVGLGQGELVVALAAMTVGERLLSKRHLPFQAYVVFAALSGSVVYHLVVALAVHLGLAATDLKLVTAVLVLVVIALRMQRDEQMHAELGT